MQKAEREIVLLKGIEDIDIYNIALPEPPAPKQIINYGLPQEQQIFRRTPIPRNLIALDEQTKIVGKEGIRRIVEAQDKLASDEELSKFVQTLWHKRIFGEWQYINGKPIYLTGDHYFYLNFYYLYGYYPQFRYTDAEEFYWWKFCVEENENAYGGTLFTRRQVGKCFAKDTLVRMYDGGSKKVQDIKNGDLVMGDDSSCRKVHGVTNGREKMYKISLKNGDLFTCNASHILSLKYNKSGKNKKYGWDKSRAVNISVEDYINLPASTKKHLCLYKSGWGKEFKKNEHYIPPYMLGVYLGDGSKHSGGITGIDHEVISYVMDFATSKNLKLRNHQLTYLLERKKECKEEYGCRENPYRKELKRIGVLPLKKIPKEYLIDSEDNRLELLAGLMDTDGHLNVRRKKNSVNQFYEITQKSKELAYSILELSRGLGFNASLASRKATLKREGKKTYECEVYRVNIFGDVQRIPCKIQRKKALEYKKRNNPLHYGFTVEEVGEGDYYGFAVDKNHLFLLSDGTVVHNSLRSSSILLNYVTAHSFAKVGIQSKTEDDAGGLFRKAITPQFKRLPFFFKPLYDSGGGMKNRIDFTHPERESLESWIDYRASTDTAYDGETMNLILVDESGKMKKPASPIDILDKIKPALMQDGKIRGKTLFITTVEEMDKGGGKEYKYIWDGSDRKKLNELGQTESGLVPYFTPAYRNIFFDQYGFPIIDNPTKEQAQWRKEQKHQFYYMGGKEYIDKYIDGAKKQSAKQDRIRKYPRNIREAFQSTTTFCHFDLEILNERLKKFTFGYPPEMMDKMTFGNFHWKDGVFGGDVEFIATSQDDARWWISYMPDENNRNKYNLHPVNNKKTPANWHKFCSGADPFKFDTDEVIHKDRMSDAAMIVYAEYDVMVDTPDIAPADHVTGDMCAEYLYRADTVDEMCEDFAKACIFYGMKVFPERNNSDVVRYFKLNGFENYIQFDMQVKRSSEGTFFAETAAGSNTDVKTIQSMFKVVQKYVKDNGLRCKFYRTLENLKEVSPDHMNPYDLFVALATCLRVVIEFNPVKLGAQEQESDDVGDIIGALSPRSYGENEPNESYGYA